MQQWLVAANCSPAVCHLQGLTWFRAAVNWFHLFTAVSAYCKKSHSVTFMAIDRLAFVWGTIVNPSSTLLRKWPFQEKITIAYYFYSFLSLIILQSHLKSTFLFCTYFKAGLKERLDSIYFHYCNLLLLNGIDTNH